MRLSPKKDDVENAGMRFSQKDDAENAGLDMDEDVDKSSGDWLSR